MLFINNSSSVLLLLYCLFVLNPLNTVFNSRAKEILIYLIFSYIQIPLKGVEFTVYLFYHTLHEAVEASLAPGSLATGSGR